MQIKFTSTRPNNKIFTKTLHFSESDNMFYLEYDVNNDGPYCSNCGYYCNHDTVGLCQPETLTLEEAMDMLIEYTTYANTKIEIIK